MKLFGNRKSEAKPDKGQGQGQGKKFDTVSLDSVEIEHILKEERERQTKTGREPVSGAQTAAPAIEPVKKADTQTKPTQKTDVRDAGVLKRWHKTCLIIAFAVLALSIAAFAFAKTYIKPPEKQGTGISSGNNDQSELNNQNTDAPVTAEPTNNTQEPTPPVGDPPAVNKNVYNILLAGFDDIDGSVHTDTMMVLSYNAEKKTINIASVPRDTYCNTSWTTTRKINSAYAIGGIETLSRELKKVMGFECDYYILVEMSAMEDLVETIGGVDFDVPCRMHYVDPTQSLYIDLYPGVQTLNGEQAVQLCRWRQNNDGFSGGLNGDLGRIDMQHDFMIALAKQCMSIKNIATNIGDYATIFSENVTSNLTTGEMIWFGLQFLNVGVEDIKTFTLEGYPDMYGDVSYYFLYASKVAAMMNEYFNPYEDHTITTADLNIVVPSHTPSTPTNTETETEPTDTGTDPTDPVTDPTDPGTDPTDPGDDGELDGAFFETPGGETDSGD